MLSPQKGRSRLRRVGCIVHHRFVAVHFLLARKFSSLTLPSPGATWGPPYCEVAVSRYTLPTICRRHACWQPTAYDLILRDVRKHPPGETLEFYERTRDASPRERFAFLVGPPVYLSRTSLGEVSAHDASQGQWGATVRPFTDAP